MDDLVALRALLQDHWTKGAMGRNAEGVSVASKDPTAVCWCLLGGMVKITGGGISDPKRFLALRSALNKASGGVGLGSFNDTATHEQVLALIDRAIEHANMPKLRRDV